MKVLTRSPTVEAVMGPSVAEVVSVKPPVIFFGRFPHGWVARLKTLVLCLCTLS